MGLYGDNIFIREGSIQIIKDFIEEWKKKREEKKKEEEERKKREEEARAKSEYEKKKREEFNNLSESEKNKIKQEWSKREKEFDKLVRSEATKMMKEPDFRAKVRKKIDDAFKSGWLDPKDSWDKQYYNNNKIPPLEISNEGDYWQIIHESQEINIICFIIVEELANRLEKITGYLIGLGDGDEGCIYPDAFGSDLYYFWRYYYNKEN